jgi:hypothetical protein
MRFKQPSRLHPRKRRRWLEHIDELFRPEPVPNVASPIPAGGIPPTVHCVLPLGHYGDCIVWNPPGQPDHPDFRKLTNDELRVHYVMHVPPLQAPSVTRADGPNGDLYRAFRKRFEVPE